jgi:O-antigen ligase/Flp pilus assembly protein TadD
LIVRLATPVVAALWALRLSRREVRPLPRPIAIAAAMYAGWLIVTTMFAVHQPTALHGAHARYNGLWNQAICLFLFLIVASSAVDVARVERLSTMMVAALVPAALYALVQFAGWDPIVWPLERSASTIGNPVILAAMLGLCLPFALVFTLQARTRITRCSWAATFLVLSLAAIVTLSRGPLIASVIALVIVGAGVVHDLRLHRGRLLAVASLVVTVSILGFGYRQVMEMRSHLSGDSAEEDLSIADRMDTLAAGARMVRDHPVLGVGLENFAVVYPRYRSAASERFKPDELPTMVHDGYLQAAATTGIPGLVSYLCFLSSVLFTLWTSYRQIPDQRTRWLVLAFVASICGYLIQDVTGWAEISLSVFFWIVLGLSVSLTGITREPAALSVPVRWFAYAVVSAWSVVVMVLAAHTLSLIRADRLLMGIQRLNVQDAWPRIQRDVSEAMKYADGDAVYYDKAGIRFAERFGVTGEPDIYKEGVTFFREAHRLDPFNSYFLIHRIALDTLALQRKTIAAAGEGSDLVSVVLAMDGNNASAYEAAARFTLTEGKAQDALPLVQRARTLRPKMARATILEGDIWHTLHDTKRAIAAYRAVLKPLSMTNPEWLPTNHKLIVSLAEEGNYQQAAEEARRLTTDAPDDARAYTLLGVMQLSMNNASLAKEAFLQALQRNPADKSASSGLAEAEARLRP